MRMSIAGWLALGLAAAAPAQAAPSLLHGGSAVPNLFGTTGLITIPTAQTVGDRGISGHVDFTENFNSYGFLIGPMDRLEVGATLFDPDGIDTRDIIFNAKFNLLGETLGTPSVSVGLTDAFDQFDVNPSWYIVASKGFPKLIPVIGGLRAHVGIGGGIYDDELFAGIEWQIFTPLDVLPVSKPSVALVADFSNDDIHVGLRGKFKGFAATVSWLNDVEDFHFGFSYTTGLRLW